jgi:Reverse transcriptase (RNA-dependent DNA polymerase)
MARSVDVVTDGKVRVRLVNATHKPIDIQTVQVTATPVHDIRSVNKDEEVKSNEEIENEQDEMIEEMVRNSVAKGTEYEDTLRTLLHKYRSIFATTDVAPVAATLPTIIDTGTHPPIRQPPRPLAPAKIEIVEQEMERLVRGELIERTDSPWAVPIVLARKKDGTWRFCCDFRGLNKITTPAHHPLPNIEQTINSITDSTVFSTLDAQQGFWQLELNSEDSRKAAFTIPSGRYKGIWQWRRMPFGL